MVPSRFAQPATIRLQSRIWTLARRSQTRLQEPSNAFCSRVLFAGLLRTAKVVDRIGPSLGTGWLLD